MIYQKTLLLGMLGLLTASLFAQQSSKTKAANKLYEKGGEVEIFNPKPINTPKIEFSPAFYQNGIVYISSSPNERRKGKERLFFSEVDVQGNPLSPQEFAMDIPYRLDSGSVTFDRAGKTLFFTSNASTASWTNTPDRKGSRLKIYQAQRSEEGWTELKGLPFNSDDYSCAYPTISTDGKQLYFASNMPGGHGGMDIYVANWEDGSWGEPVNLGKGVNTKKNEIFPFIHSTGNLFFSSNGHAGAGGFDLYMADLSKQSTSTIVTNLGEPFNTPDDDLSVIINPDGTQGYFTSNRSDQNMGGKDIYLFTVEKGIWGRTGAKEINTNLDIYDMLTGERINGAQVRIFEKQEPLSQKKSEDLFAGVLFPSDDGKTLEFAWVRKDQKQANESSLVSDKKGRVAHEFLGERKYLLVISKEGFRSREVGYSTVGNQGKDKLRIGLERVECVTLDGQVKDKTTGTGLTDAIIKIKNTCDGAEQFILTDQQGQFNVCLPTGCDYVVIGNKEKYASQLLTFTNLDSSATIKQEWSLKPTKTKRLKEGTVIVLAIDYDFGKSFIREGPSRALDELFFLLQKNPEMIVELSAHTDSRGKATYNQRLSRQRAESTQAYLVSRGIAAERIIAVGHGESQIRNRCRDGARCTDKEHNDNNRIEVKVLKM